MGEKNLFVRLFGILSGISLVVLMSVIPSGHAFAYEELNSSQKLLVDFNSEDERRNWRIINDGVMGGLSRSELSVKSESIAVFRGTISLENRGGFASVRTYPNDYNLSGFDGLAVRVKGDGKRYQLRVRMDNEFDGITYKAGFQTTPDQWMTVHMGFAEFAPSFHGRLVTDAPRLTPNKIRQIGFLIADKQEGPFQLEIDWIKAYRK
jgi:monofunctional biosynthetic peptidoglycan transglycosylase